MRREVFVVVDGERVTYGHDRTRMKKKQYVRGCPQYIGHNPQEMTASNVLENTINF